MSEVEQHLLDKMSALEHKAKNLRSSLTPDITEACQIILEYVAETREFKLAAMVGLEQREGCSSGERTQWELSAFQCYAAE
jgi:hypothetical protein